MTQHTQGTWTVDPTDCTKVSIKGETIANCDRGLHYPVHADPVAKANARLIAQAPELLEAFEWCAEVYGRRWPECSSIRAIIRKARGQ